MTYPNEYSMNSLQPVHWAIQLQLHWAIPFTLYPENLEKKVRKKNGRTFRRYDFHQFVKTWFRKKRALSLLITPIKAHQMIRNLKMELRTDLGYKLHLGLGIERRKSML